MLYIKNYQALEELIPRNPKTPKEEKKSSTGGLAALLRTLTGRRIIVYTAQNEQPFSGILITVSDSHICLAACPCKAVQPGKCLRCPKWVSSEVKYEIPVAWISAVFYQTV
ncbi:hypothetical protein [Caproiciproducens sp. LBM24188]